MTDYHDPNPPFSGGSDRFRLAPWWDPNPPITDGPPPGQFTRPNWGFHGVRPSSAALPQRTLSVSSTVWDNAIPFAFGANRVSGLIGAIKVTSTYIYAGIILAIGEQDGISDVLLAGDTVPSEITVLTHNGDGTALGAGNTGAILKPSIMYSSGYTWGAADDALWKNLAHIAVQIPTTIDVPSLDFSAIVGGQVFDDWAGTGGTWTNPAKVAWYIYQASQWIGDLTSRLDDGAGGTWRRLGDWCSEVMGDTTARYEFVGVLQWRTAQTAISEVLGHCFAVQFMADDGTVKVAAELPPEAISGTWSASASATLTGSGGDAANELEAGDRVYLDGYFATYGVVSVVSIGGPDSITLDQAVTVAAGTKVRPLPYGGIKIRDTDWLRRPIIAARDTAELADYYRVKFEYPTSTGSDWKEYQATAGTSRRVETTLSGCPGASMALRVATTQGKLDHLRRFRFEKGVDRSGRAARLEPGDVFEIEVAGRTWVVQLEAPRINQLTDGTVALARMVQFHGDAYSKATATNRTLPGDNIEGWNRPPAAVSSVAYGFSYYGASSNLALYHDDVNNWTTKSAVTITANDANGPGSLSVGTADLVTPTSSLAYIAGPGAIGGGRAGVPITRAMVFLKADTSGAGVEGDVEVQTVGSNEKTVFVRDWWRWYPAPGTAGSGAVLRINFPSGSATPVHVCGAGAWISDGDWRYKETVTWTAPGDVSGIRHVTLQYKTSSGGPWVTHAEVPVGAETISWGSSIEAEFPPLPPGWYDWRLVTVGVNPRYTTAFPDPSSTSYTAVTEALENLDGQKYVTPGSGNTIDFGDPAGGDYSSFEDDGRLTMHGDARPWNDLRVPGLDVRTTGSNAPSLTQWKTDGSGSNGIYLYEFVYNLEKEVFFTVQLPHSYDQATDIKPHVHYLGDTSENSVTVRWKFEYTWANVNGTFAANTTLSTVDETGDFTADKHIVTGLGTLTGTGKKESSILVCRLSRDGADAADTYSGSVLLLSIDFHFLVGKLGTDDEFPA